MKDQAIKPNAKRLILMAKQQGSLENTAETLLEAWRTDQSNTQLTLLVSMELSDLGLQAKAIDLLQEFLQCNPLSKEVLQVAGKIAFEIAAFDVAAKLYQQVIAYDPGDASSYELLVSALAKAEQYDAAVNLLQEILPVFPKNAHLWLALGETLDLKKGVNGDSKVFYEQAYELAPKDYRVLTSYANALEADSKAAPVYEQALAVNPSGVEANLGMAISEFSRGNLAKAWPHYEYRLDPSRSADEVATYQVKAPTWKGEPLAGKSLLVMAEQGIGDEVFFAANFQSLVEECQQLFIGCEPRLVSIFQRSFPTAIVGAFEDTVSGGQRLRSFPSIMQYLKENRIKLDYAVSFGSSCAPRWSAIEDLPNQSSGYLVADPDLTKQFEDRCKTSTDGNLRVGLSWQSGKLTKGRKHSYPGLEGMMAILRQPGIDFFILQYSFEKDVIEEFIAEHGIPLHAFYDVDLKQDIEANLAIMEHMDVIIGPAIATQSFAMALGKPVCLVCDGLPWTAFGQTDGKLPIFENARTFPKIADAWAPAYDLLRVYLKQKFPNSDMGVPQSGSALVQVPENWVHELRNSFRATVLETPLPPQAVLVLDQYFSKLEGLKLGICWGNDFDLESARHNEAYLRLVPDLVGNFRGQVICLHADINREAAIDLFGSNAEGWHFFEDFGLDNVYCGLSDVLDQLDLAIGPESFITLAALLQGTRTVITGFDASWDLTNDQVCKPIQTKGSKWFDFRPEFREAALEQITSIIEE